MVETEGDIIGVESKRFEPFRGHKTANLSEAYDRDVWGQRMESWCKMRDRLRAAPKLSRHLDAGQLVKHAFALATEATRSGKRPTLVYLYAEPTGVGGPSDAECLAHRREIEVFAAIVAGGRVQFAACSWQGWLAAFKGEAASHAERVLEAFRPMMHETVREWGHVRLDQGRLSRAQADALLVEARKHPLAHDEATNILIDRQTDWSPVKW